MSARRIRRPVVRSFKSRFVREAAAHVRSGGHAVIWETETHAKLVLPVPIDDDVMDLSYWSVLDLGKWRWTLIESGTLSGFATLRVPADCLDIVRRRAERDAAFAGPFHEVRLDCLTCGACCRDNRVELDKNDVQRFMDAGRVGLTREPYAKRDNGKIVLRLTRSKRCRHLADDNRCAIYSIRPDACRTFPMGSECCLSAREEELGLVDGLPASN